MLKRSSRITPAPDASAGSDPTGAQPKLFEANVSAAAEVGSNGKGRDGLLGYLMFLAKEYPVQYAQLLAKAVDFEPPRKVPPKTFRTQEEIEAEMKARGLPIPKNMFS